MNNTSTRTEILEALENINSVTMESSLDVMFKIGESYDKAAVILENYNGSDLSSFAIFQEADGEEGSAVQSGKPEGENTAEAKKKDKDNKDQSVFMKILLFIPNVFKKLWQFIKDAWNGVIVPKAGEITGDVADKLSEISEKMSKTEEEENEGTIKKILIGLGITGAAAAAIAAVIMGVIVVLRSSIKKKLEAFNASLKVLGFGKEVVFIIKNGGFYTNLKEDGLKGLFQAIGDCKYRISKAYEKYVQKKKDNPQGDGASNIPPEVNNVVNEGQMISPEVVSNAVSDEPTLTTWDKVASFVTTAKVGFDVVFNQNKGDIDDLFNAVKSIATNKDTTISDADKGIIGKLNTKATQVSTCIAKASDLFKNICSGGTKVVNSLRSKLSIIKNDGDNLDENEVFNKHDNEEDSGDVTNDTNAAAEKKAEEDNELSVDEEENIINSIGVNESAKEEVPEDGSVVSEAATWYNRF